MRDPESERRVNFVRETTAVTPALFVPEVRLHTATEVTPLWQATADWLEERNAAIPFWAVPWAGGQALARFILDRRETVSGLSVVDFGTGGGIVAIAAMLAGARSVTAIDIDPIACTAARLNAEINRVTIDVACKDIVGEHLTADVVLAGDVWYEEVAARRFADWLGRQSARVLTGDPGRAYPPADATELARYAVPTSIELESAVMRTSRVLEIGKLSGP